MTTIDTGQKWLGAVPSTWHLAPLGSIFQERKETVSDTEFPALSVTKNGVVPQLEDVAKTVNNDSRKLVRAGDLVINSRSDRKGSSGVSALDGSVSVIYTVLRPRDAINPRFVHHLLRSTAFQEEYYRWGTGIVADLWSTRYSSMKQILTALPPLNEQQLIADYLDRETQRIDELIAEQRGLIETLRERREAMISSTICAEAPRVRLKHIIDVDRPLTYGIVQAGPPVQDGVIYIGPSDIVNHKVVATEYLRQTTREIAQQYRRSAVCSGDLIVSIGPAYGKTMIVPAELAGANLTQDTARVACDPLKVVSRYAQWVLMAVDAKHFWDSRIMGATFRRLNLDILAQTPVPLPSVRRQREISAYLDDQTSRIDALIAESEDLIALSQERRAALITAAVTGQIDVRTAA